MRNASLLADPVVALSDPQRAIAAFEGPFPLLVTGPAGSGKTTALAALAARWTDDGAVTVICANEGSCAAFEAAAARLGVRERLAIGTLSSHLASWMRGEFAASGASPRLSVGAEADSIALAREAGRTILDMTWPGFRNTEFVLDLPFLARPDVFFEEAAALFRQLRRRLVDTTAFSDGCAAGIEAFYGEDVERARALCADGNVRPHASHRGREAMSATVDQLRVQRRAERDLAVMLAFLYGEYARLGSGRAVLSAEDVIAEGIGWLQRDRDAVERLTARSGGFVVDDAEDAEPALAQLFDAFQSAGGMRLAAAICPASAIDGIHGRRALPLGDAVEKIVLPPPAVRATTTAARFSDEEAESDAVARDIRELLERSSVQPSEIVVLTRDRAAAAIYVRALSERGVPITAPHDAWQAPEDVADLLALACVIDDPYDHAHLLRVLSSPVVAMTDLSLLRLCRDPEDADQLALDVGLDDARLSGGRGIVSTTLAENVLYGLADQRLSDGARASLAAFRGRSKVWRSACARMSPPSAIAYLMETGGFRAAWHAAPEHLRERLADDARRLIAAASGLGGDLGEVSRTLESGLAAIEPAKASAGAVISETIGGVKGKRASYVFVTGVAHNRFPRVYVSHALAFTKQWGLIARENVAGGASQTAKFAWYYAKHGAKRMYIEEERRALAYALSRADIAAHASGYGTTPRWAADQDLLSTYGA